jgi:hypothetical protein
MRRFLCSSLISPRTYSLSIAFGLAAPGHPQIRSTLFRFDRWVAARRAGRGDDRHSVARRWRRPLHPRIDSGGRSDDSTRAAQLGAARSTLRWRGGRTQLAALVFSCPGGSDQTDERNREKPYSVHCGLRVVVSRQTPQKATNPVICHQPERGPPDRKPSGYLSTVACGWARNGGRSHSLWHLSMYS